ncbi:MAG: GPR endopeptidase [Oscillospiraceae bacterium]|jgi:spore protease|nr:GPR endopeptidase [Oscillospiraceae bacterium]
MNFRTDLALEMREAHSGSFDGLHSREERHGQIKITRVEVTSQAGAKAIGKPVGIYVTLEFPSLDHLPDLGEEAVELGVQQLRGLIPADGAVLCVGLGNDAITPDSLGPKTLEKILATRHISGEQAHSVGVGELRPVACLVPGVLGRTGIESAELLQAAVEKLRPGCVIMIDALASRRLSRLGRTVQISTGGITPGSGVGNARAEISRGTLGVPVISIGMPCVVDAATLAVDLLSQGTEISRDDIRATMEPDGEQMMVTPREVDLLIDRASKLIAMMVNLTLQPNLAPEDFTALMG